MAASCEPVDDLRESPDFLLLAQRRAGTVPIFCQVSVQTVSISLLIYAPFFAMFLLFDFYSCNCLVMLDCALGPKLSLPACYLFQAVNSNSLAPNLQVF